MVLQLAMSLGLPFLSLSIQEVRTYPLFHQMLLHQLERFRIEILYSQKVVLYWESKGTGKGCVMTDQGERFEADLVLAADGLHSKSRDVVVGGQGNGKPTKE